MSRRLLLVDDDDSIREIATLSLQRVGGWDVIPASGGQEAIETAKKGGDFDVVVLDVMMPEIDGPETLERLRAGPLAADVPVVFLTAKLQAADRQRLHALGARGVIAKPFDPMTLPAELERVLGSGR